MISSWKKCVFTYINLWNILLLPFIRFESQIRQLNKYSVEKSKEGTLVSEMVILAQQWSQFFFWSLQPTPYLWVSVKINKFILPAVHTGGVSRGRVCDCGCKWLGTCVVWPLTPKKILKNMLLIFFVIFLVSVHTLSDSVFPVGRIFFLNY